jgi:hypothetical protein
MSYLPRASTQIDPFQYRNIPQLSRRTFNYNAAAVAVARRGVVFCNVAIRLSSHNREGPRRCLLRTYSGCPERRDCRGQDEVAESIHRCPPRQFASQQHADLGARVWKEHLAPAPRRESPNRLSNEVSRNGASDANGATHPNRRSQIANHARGNGRRDGRLPTNIDAIGSFGCLYLSVMLRCHRLVLRWSLGRSQA